MANEPSKTTRKTTPKAAPKTTPKPAPSAVASDTPDTMSAELRVVWAKRYSIQAMEQSEPRSTEERLEMFESWDGDASDLLED